MTRTTQEVFESHKKAVDTLDFEKLASDYAEDALLVTLDRSYKGREEIMTGFFQTLMTQFPGLKINFEKTVVEDEVCLLQWSAESTTMTVPIGTAVFIIQDGLIRRQGEWYQIVPKD